MGQAAALAMAEVELRRPTLSRELLALFRAFLGDVLEERTLGDSCSSHCRGLPGKLSRTKISGF